MIHSIEQGDDGNVNMKSPFAGNTATRIPELADGEGETAFKPEIYVSTPNAGGGGYKYDARVSIIEQALVGPGRAFEGIPVKRRGYTIKRPPDSRSAHGKVLIQYTNDQQNDMGERIVCPQTAIYRLWFETEKMSDHEWPAAGDQVAAGNNNRKRQNGACGPSASSGSSIGTATGTNPGSTNIASTNTAGTITGGGSTGTGIGSGGATTGASSTAVSCAVTTTTYKPADASFGLTGFKTYCQCGPTIAGLNYATSGISTISFCATGGGLPAGFTQLPANGQGPITSAISESALSSTAAPVVSPPKAESQSSANLRQTCQHNPTRQDPPNCVEPPSSSEPFKCSAGSNVGVATYDPATWCGCNSPIGTLYPTMTTASGDAACAYTKVPDTTVKPTAVPVDTASINSVASASSSSSSAEASWSSAAAVPSAGCSIMYDNGFGDSAFRVYGINGWAGEDGSKLEEEEDGCGILDLWSFDPDEQSEFEGRLRKTQTAEFGLGFFKGGCVERAVASAGGPSPDGGPYEIHCEHLDKTKKGRKFRRDVFKDTWVEDEA